MRDDLGADLRHLLAHARQRPQFDLPGKARVRKKLARLYASAWSWSRTAFARNAVHESRVHLTAFFPSLIHCSAVPRPL